MNIRFRGWSCLCAAFTNHRPGGPKRQAIARTGHWHFLLVLLALLSTHASRPESTNTPAISFWDKSLNLRAGFGYKDNILLSPERRQESTFFASGFDAMLIRLPVNGPQLLFFLTGDDYRYLNDVSVDKEQTLVGVAKIEQDFAQHWKAAFGLEYLYQDQVFDVSATEADLTTVQLVAHAIKATPSIERIIAERNHLRLELPATRQYLREPLDDYWEAGPKLTYLRDYGNRSSAWISYEFLERLYDDREETDRSGAPQDGTTLLFQQHEFEIGQRHYWDAKRRWRNDTKLALELNSDSGSGFFDYRRYQASEQLRFTTTTLMLRAQGKASYYDYTVQQVADDNPDKRHFATVGFNLRAEKNLIKTLKLYAEYDYEQAISNRPLHEYHVNTVIAGFDWEF